MYVAEGRLKAASYIHCGRKMSVIGPKGDENAILQQMDVPNESGILIPLSFAIQRQLNGMKRRRRPVGSSAAAGC